MSQVACVAGRDDGPWWWIHPTHRCSADRAVEVGCTVVNAMIASRCYGRHTLTHTRAHTHAHTQREKHTCRQAHAHRRARAHTHTHTHTHKCATLLSHAHSHPQPRVHTPTPSPPMHPFVGLVADLGHFSFSQVTVDRLLESRQSSVEWDRMRVDLKRFEGGRLVVDDCMPLLLPFNAKLQVGVLKAAARLGPCHPLTIPCPHLPTSPARGPRGGMGYAAASDLLCAPGVGGPQDGKGGYTTPAARGVPYES